ncbi:hypothetical protein WN943_025492 [Citrus x changshan-huyou]
MVRADVSLEIVFVKLVKADYAFDCNFGEAYAIFPFLYLQADYAFGCDFVEASTKSQACKGDNVPTCMIPNAAMCSPFHICPCYLSSYD